MLLSGAGIAAQLAYYFFLSLFPALLFLVALVSFFPLYSFTDELMRLLGPIAPAGVVTLLQDQLTSLVSVIDAMNRAYDIEDSRAWWKRRVIAIALTIGLALFILTSFGQIVAGPWLADFLGRQLGLAPAFTLAWKILQWPVVFLFASTGFGLVYYFAPDAEQEWVWITPGALVATMLWFLASLAFRYYVVNFGNYEEAYGTPGGIILTLLWFYITGLAMVIGAEVSAEIHRASPWGKNPGTADSRAAEAPWSCGVARMVQARCRPPSRKTDQKQDTWKEGHAGPIYALFDSMEHITFEFMLGFFLAVGLMVALWVPLFFFDYKAEKRRGAEPVGSGENPPAAPLDKVHLD